MENVNFNHLYYFHVVAEEGSLSAAAHVLSVTKPTISAQLRQLEDFFGHRLFDRRGNRLRLNEQGRIAYRHTQQMFESGRSLVRYFREREPDPPTLLRVGLATTIAGSLAADFLTPLLELDRIRLRVRSLPAEDLQRALLDLDVDIQIGATRPPEPATLGVECVCLRRVPLVLVASLETARQLRSAIPAEVVASSPFFHYEAQSDLHWRVQRWLRDNDITPHIVGELDNAAAMAALLREGNGVGILPRDLVLPQLSRDELTLIGDPDLHMPIFASYLDRDVPEVLSRAIALLSDSGSSSEASVNGAEGAGGERNLLSRLEE